jgi:probable O-glycosylation ligase (exosortase A-associated)
MTSIDTCQKEKFDLPFLLLLFYFFVEYARPAFIANIRPALLVQIVLICYLIGNKEKLSTILKEKYFKLYLLLLILMIPHIFLAVNNYSAFTQFVRMITFLIIGLSLCVFVDTYRKLNALLTFFVFVMFCCVIDRIVGGGKAGGAGFIGATGSMFDENDFALAMNVVLPISFFLGRVGGGWKKLFFWSASVLFVFGVMISGSRGGFLGLVAVGLACLIYSKHKLRAVPVIAILVVMSWTFAPPDTKDQIMGLGFDSADKDTGKERIELWKAGWRVFLDNPVFGVGQGNMPIVIEKYQYDDLTGESFWKRGIWGKAVHSVYFTLLPELGILGVIIFVLMLKELLRKFKEINTLCNNSKFQKKINGYKNLNIALMVGMFGFLVSGTFLSALYYPYFWNISALIVVLFLRASEDCAVDTQIVSIS